MYFNSKDSSTVPQSLVKVQRQIHQSQQYNQGEKERNFKEQEFLFLNMYDCKHIRHSHKTACGALTIVLSFISVADLKATVGNSFFK